LGIPPVLATEDVRKQWEQMGLKNRTTHPDSAMSVDFSPDGKELAVGTMGGMVHFFGVQEGILRRSFIACQSDVGFGCEAIAISPDGLFIATTGSSSKKNTKTDNSGAKIWRVSDSKMIDTLEVSLLDGIPERVSSIAWSPRGNVMVVVDAGAMRVWHIDKTGHKLLFVKKTRDIHSAKYSPQGDLAIAIAKEILILR